MEKLVILGKGNPSGQNVALGESARARSTYVIGITGTGKSTCLESMAYQDIANGDGLCFLDPHGDSVRKLLASVPDYRESDVILWDPSDIDRPFGFNPFYCSDPTNELEVSRKAQSFIDALGSLKEFASIFESAPRMKNMLQQLATTFIVNQGHTLAETPKFLLDQAYREQFYPALSNRFARIRRYWEDELDSRSERERREISESSLNKLERFQSDPVLYSIFGQTTNSIDFRAAMDSGKILLINLGADRGGMIGAFVVWELLQAAFSRAEV